MEGGWWVARIKCKWCLVLVYVYHLPSPPPPLLPIPHFIAVFASSALSLLCHSPFSFPSFFLHLLPPPVRFLLFSFIIILSFRVVLVFIIFVLLPVVEVAAAFLLFLLAFLLPFTLLLIFRLLIFFLTNCALTSC